jgi:uncharacterized phage-associated protein
MNNYKAMDIANYIVDYVNENNLGVLTPLKLQKILYYVSATYLKRTSDLLFSESFEKWQYGPVATSVYHNFKSFGINHIESTVPIIEIDTTSILGFKKVEFSKENFQGNDRFQDVAKDVIKKLIGVSAFDLVELTHQEEAWSKFEPLIAKGVKDLKYSKDELLNAKEF